MPIVFPLGATHARQIKNGMEEILPLGGERWMGEGLKIDFGVYRDCEFVPLTSEQLEELVRKTTPAFPAPKSAESSINKTKFITELLTKEPGKFTAKEIATMVVEKFGGDFEKAISFTRAVPWHLKQKGINVKYKKESEVEEASVVPVPPVSAATESALLAARRAVDELRNGTSDPDDDERSNF